MVRPRKLCSIDNARTKQAEKKHRSSSLVDGFVASESYQSSTHVFIPKLVTAVRVAAFITSTIRISGAAALNVEFNILLQFLSIYAFSL